MILAVWWWALGAWAAALLATWGFLYSAGSDGQAADEAAAREFARRRDMDNASDTETDDA